MESLENMNANEYQQGALRTLMSNAEQANKIICALEAKPRLAQLMVAGMKLSSESGELNDAIVKHISYGQELDVSNLKEECGDLLWYIAVILQTLECSFEEAMEANINKLKIRYPEKFTEKDAAERKDKIVQLEQFDKKICGCYYTECCDICHPPEPTDKEVVDDGHISDRERI